jgi:hypothetical protein
MKKSRIALSVAFALAIVGAVFTKTIAQQLAFIQVGDLCVTAAEPAQCDTTSSRVCNVSGVVFWQLTEDGTTCLLPYKMP